MLDNSQIKILLAIFLLFYFVKKFVAWRQAIRSVKYACDCSYTSIQWIDPGLYLRPSHSDWPGFRTVLSDAALYFPFRLRGISPGPNWAFWTKYEDHAQAGWDVICAVSRYPSWGST